METASFIVLTLTLIVNAFQSYMIATDFKIKKK